MIRQLTQLDFNREFSSFTPSFQDYGNLKRTRTQHSGPKGTLLHGCEYSVPSGLSAFPDLP